jgi:hypothetical protein
MVKLPSTITQSICTIYQRLRFSPSTQVPSFLGDRNLITYAGFVSTVDPVSIVYLLINRPRLILPIRSTRWILPRPWQHEKQLRKRHLRHDLLGSRHRVGLKHQLIHLFKKRSQKEVRHTYDLRVKEFMERAEYGTCILHCTAQAFITEHRRIS